MSPEERAKLNELYEWMQERKRQQISLPVDLASKAALGVPTSVGPGSTGLTTGINLTGDVQAITVPKAYSGTHILEIEGALREFPYL